MANPKLWSKAGLVFRTDPAGPHTITSLVTNRRIKTCYEMPPIPNADHWRAYDDSLGADCSPYGEGATEQEAIDDLMVQLEEMETPI